MRNQDIKRNIFQTACFFLGLFIVLIGWISYLQIVKSAELSEHPMNSRSQMAADHVARGAIVDARGTMLAYSEKTQQGYRRIYPEGKQAAPVTGYIGKEIGNAGMEAYAGSDLAGSKNLWQSFGPLAQIFASDSGNTVKLTLDMSLQKTAYEALGSRRGAVVVLDSRTGAVLAMVSKPSFDPNTIEEHWADLQKATDGSLLNRATQGLYPPGSTLKTLIADAALKENLTSDTEVFDCPGYLKVGSGYTLYESHHAVHGKIHLKEALTESCNVTFGTLGLRLGANRLESAFERFGFTKPLGNEMNEAVIRLPDFKHLSDGEICQIGIGQSTMLVTPMRMAMLAAAFSNQGMMMKPYLLDEVISPGHFILKKNKPEKWLEVTTPERAQLIQSYMRSVVEKGTGQSAAVDGVPVIGKTGTAENAGGADHAWFIGAASLPRQNIAFAVIVENSGGGGAEAAPIARKIIIKMLETEEVSP